MSNHADIVKLAFVAGVESLLACGQARTDALYVHALREARKTADGFVVAQRLIELEAHQAIQAKAKEGEATGG